MLSPEERQDIVNCLALHPRAGDLIPATGGIRKLRWGRDGRGKRGGVRMISYYHSGVMPLYLPTVFAKNEQADLSGADCAGLAKLADALVAAWNER